MNATALVSTISAAYEAAFDSSGKRWLVALEDLSNAVCAGGWAVLALQRERHDLSRVLLHQIEESAAASYRDYYAEHDPVLETAVSRAPAGTVLLTDELISRRSLMHTEFYADWLRPMGVFSGAGAMVFQNGQTRALLHLARETKAGPFEKADVAHLSLLIPHIQRAMQLTVELSTPSTLRVGDSVLNQLSHPIFVVDASGRVVYANGAGDALLSARDGLATERTTGDRSGIVRGATPEVTASLRRFIAGAAATSAMRSASSLQALTRTTSSGGTVTLPRPSGKARLMATIAPLYTRQQEVDSVFSALASHPAGGYALLSVADPSEQSHERESDSAVLGFLRAQFGLTTAESAVALNISCGDGLRVVAHRRGVSVATVRAQAMRIYTKTGVRSQAALAKLIGRLTGGLLLVTESEGGGNEL